MDDEKNQESQLYDLQQTAEAIEKLSADPKAFAAAYEAFVAGDADKFGAALGQVGISDRCRWVCRFFCRKRCAGVCRKFCPSPSTVEVNADEILGFAKAVGPMLQATLLLPAAVRNHSRRKCRRVESGNCEGQVAAVLLPTLRHPLRRVLRKTLPQSLSSRSADHESGKYSGCPDRCSGFRARTRRSP